MPHNLVPLSTWLPRTTSSSQYAHSYKDTRDVLTTLQVQYCVTHNVPLLAQNGGHGWINSFDIHSNGIIINLAGLSQVTVSANKTQATIGGGALISQVIAGADAAGVQVQTGNCNCVGALGAYLGAGYGNLMGLYGFGVDNLISLNVVTAQGKLITVSPTNDPDLWWAMRGAGPNFGIVTSAVVNAYPTPAGGNMAWLGPLLFTQDKLETLITAFNNLVLEPNMNIFLYYVTNATSADSPTVGTPEILLTPFYYGSEADGKAAFASIYAVGPYFDGTAETEYSHWNDGAASFCIKGDRKPSYGAAYAHMLPATWRAIWNEFVAWTSNPGTGGSTVLVEAYSLIKARTFPDNSSSFPFRNNVNFNAVAIPWYKDPALDATA